MALHVYRLLDHQPDYDGPTGDFPPARLQTVAVRPDRGPMGRRVVDDPRADSGRRDQAWDSEHRGEFAPVTCDCLDLRASDWDLD